MILSGLHYSGLARAYSALGFSRHIGVILTFHHVRESYHDIFNPNGHLAVDPVFFEEVILHCKKIGLEPVSLDEAYSRIETGTSAKPFVAFTFDDGYRNNLEIAAPILQKHDVPYTVFVATGLIDGTANLWWEGLEAVVRQREQITASLANGKVEFDCSTLSRKHKTYSVLLDYVARELPENQMQGYVRTLCDHHGVDLDSIRTSLMMTWDEVATLGRDPLCTIGAHTLTHPALARLDEAQAKFEIVAGAVELENKLGQKPHHFAYPYGTLEAASTREYNLSKDANYDIAVTTRPGMIFPQHKDTLTALPRVSVNGLYQNMSFFASLMSGLPTLMLNRGKRL